MNKEVISGRQSNFELLRIIAILMIISGHLYDQGFIDLDLGRNEVFAIIVGSGHRIAVNLFLMIGVYFMVDSSYETSRVLKLWGETWSYSVLITFIMLVLGVDISSKTLVKCIFPCLLEGIWYPAIYIILIFLSPILKEIINRPKEELWKIVVIGFFIICIYCSVISMENTRLCKIVWFAYIYLFMGYYKKYGFRLPNKNLMLIQSILIYVMLTLVRVINLYYQSPIITIANKYAVQYLMDYKSVMNLICAFGIFTYFSQLQIGEIKWINILAKGTFAVYIIHQVPSFYDFMWKEVFQTRRWCQSTGFVFFYIGTIIVIFIGASCIDALRRKFIEPFIVSKLFVKTAKVVDEMWIKK